MKKKLIYSLMFGATILVAGCSSNDSSVNSQKNEPTLTNITMQSSDGKILGVLVALNKNVIAAATNAQQHSTNIQVRKYADLMYSEHSKNLQETQSLSQKLSIVPVQSSTALSLQQDGNKELSHLSRLNGAAFDNAYINAMVTDHQAALKLITQLISQAKNPYIKRHLEITKGHVAMHLKTAISIQNHLMR